MFPAVRRRGFSLIFTRTQREIWAIYPLFTLSSNQPSAIRGSLTASEPPDLVIGKRKTVARGQGHGLDRGKFGVTPRSDISVIIPYYNREQYIDEAVQSVLAQTLKPLEIILVNDCSRESSRRALDHYADTCRIIDLTRNVGLAGSRNEGIRAARGEFIALLDDDDIWLPNKLEVQRQYMEENPQCSAVHCSVTAFFANKPDEVWTYFGAGPMTLAQALTDVYWVVPSTLMIRAHVLRTLGSFDESFRECEDRDFMIRSTAAGYRIEGIRQPLIRFRRVGNDRLSERRWRMFRVHARICWLHRGKFVRAYGIRGLLSFLLATLRVATFKTRYLDGGVRRLLQVIPVKWQIRPGYCDPVSNHESGRSALETARVPLASAGGD